MSTDLSTTLALSAAALFLAACTKGQADSAVPGSSGADADTKVKCLGVNECAGQAACDMPTHSCAGQNECKGKGWVLTTQADCDDKGGTVKT